MGKKKHKKARLGKIFAGGDFKPFHTPHNKTVRLKFNTLDFLRSRVLLYYFELNYNLIFFNLKRDDRVTIAIRLLFLISHG